MDEIKSKFDNIIIDTVNLCYKLFKKEDPSILSNKLIYKNFVKNFIFFIEELKNRFLDSEGKVYLLFDNYFSRADLQNSFMYAARKRIDENYKKGRSKNTKEFYNSINLIRYYYLIGPSNYYTMRVEGLEADDLVKPLIENRLKGKKNLLVTNDLDWCRYLDGNTQWLPDLVKEPETCDELSQRLGFRVNEKSIVCFKSLFGDPSDNIPEVARKSKENLNLFTQVIKEVKYPEDLIKLARNHAAGNPLYMDILGNERQLTINFQLTGTLPCNRELFNNNLLPGRNTDTLYKSLREILGIESQRTFVFGNVKRPRV